MFVWVLGGLKCFSLCWKRYLVGFMVEVCRFELVYRADVCVLGCVFVLVSSM
jgi:hypothetical protein